MPYPALALHPRLAEIDCPGLLKLRKLLDRLPFWPEHGMNEMKATIRIGQNMGDEQALIDLIAFFGALLLMRALRLNTLPGRQ